MFILKIILYFSSLLLPGFLLLRIFNWQRDKTGILQAALAFGLGSSFVSLILFSYFFIFRWHDSIFLFVIVWGLIFILGLFSIFKNSKFRFVRPRFSLKTFWRSQPAWQKLILIIILFFLISNLFFLFSDAAARPAGQFDSLTMWSFKAKILYYQGWIDFNPAATFYLGGGSHLNYPWQIPLQEFWLHKNLGIYDDLATNWIFLAYFLSLLILVFFCLKKSIGSVRALVFSFFLFSMPFIFYHGFNAYADLPLAFYILGALGFFYSWLTQRRREDFVLAAVFWGLSFWVKDTAFIFFLAFLTIFLLYLSFRKLNWRQLAGFLLIVVGLAAPWLIFRQAYGLGFSNVDSGLVFKPEIIGSFLDSLFVSYSWNIWWFIFLVGGISFYEKIIASQEILFIWLFLLASFLFLIGLFVFTLEYSYALDQTALSRCLISLAGVSVLAVGLLFTDKHL